MHPVIIIIVVVVVILVVNVVRIAVKSSRSHFECPACGEHFQASFAQSFFTAHSLGGQYHLTCPKCGQTGLMTSLPGKQ
ncbi:MAG: phage terminase large subunit family protein [Propionibacteriaceae bacterium]|jgi:predicted RNA-binding Zn-ribbon protein involved in translation (DUF1610 family)|nr:phage terminase large subunit family protein [Propionibacteriaceae bacterium]